MLTFTLLYFLESLDWVIGSLSSTGMIEYWSTLRQRRSLSQGKSNARKNMKLIPILNGKNEKTEDSIIPLLLRVLALGVGVALCTFVGEVLASWIRKFVVDRQSKD